MRAGDWVLGLAALVVLGAIGFVAYASEPPMAPIEPPLATAFDPALVRKGAALAALGNCNSCHTAPGGGDFAGGLGLATPIGTIYSSNITPDAETGIGRWSEAAFTRAMRRGVDRAGRHLYPAFPYEHFSRVTEADDRAIYAYLMTRPAVRAQTPASPLPFPLNERILLAGWNLLFFHPPRQAGEADRGAYLVDGLAHCGGCHTPRNRLGAEEADKALGGAAVEGWYAYALNGASPAPVAWSQAALAHYLRHGWAAQHGVARGPMAEVTANLAAVDPADVAAIAATIAQRMGVAGASEGAPAPVGPTVTTALLQRGRLKTALPEASTAEAGGGEAIYRAACAGCHEAGRALPYGGMGLQESSAVHGPAPTNLVNVVLNGLPAAAGQRAPIMPGFAGTLDDGQVEALVAYLRTHFAAGQRAWTGVGASIRAGRVVVVPGGGR